MPKMSSNIDLNDISMMSVVGSTDNLPDKLEEK